MPIMSVIEGKEMLTGHRGKVIEDLVTLRIPIQLVNVLPPDNSMYGFDVGGFPSGITILLTLDHGLFPRFKATDPWTKETTPIEKIEDLLPLAKSVFERVFKEMGRTPNLANWKRLFNHTGQWPDIPNPEN